MLIRTLCLLVLLAIPTPAAAARYIVQPGDSLSSISARYHVSVAALARANGIRNPNVVRAGSILVIPSARREFNYHVRWGDSLTGIAWKFRTTVGELRALNPSLGAYPLAGQWLRICSPCGGVPAGGASTYSAGGGSTYVVQVGDNLTTIAARYGISLASLMSANGISNPNRIIIGTRLTIPGAWSPSYAPATARWLITSYAAQYGIEASLPLAVAYEESGFNQSVISRTGAIGVMQVEPYTAEVIARYWGRPVNLYQLDDNIHAGVYWLASLVRFYGGNETLAIAAYYQGTRSIAANGFYTDTTQYVNNVLALKSSFGG